MHLRPKKHQHSWYAGIGSRKTPDEILLIMARVGRTLTDQGYSLSSGDAIGADYAFYVGARLSANFYQTSPRIFLSCNGYGGRFHNPKLGFLDAETFGGTYAMARETAERARGGFYNLSEDGVKLHTRNVFQILGATLEDPVRGVYFYAEPRPRTPDKVKGGTNTAIELAKLCGITRRYNLFYDDVRANALGWLANNEDSSPYPDHLLDLIHSRREGNPVF